MPTPTTETRAPHAHGWEHDEPLWYLNERAGDLYCPSCAVQCCVSLTWSKVYRKAEILWDDTCDRCGAELIR